MGSVKGQGINRSGPMQKPEAAAIRKKMLGVLLRNARLRAGMTIKEAAKATGFSPGAISDYEYGRRDSSLPHLEVLAYTYRVPITYFWSDDPIADGDGDRELPLEEAMDLRRRIIGVLLRQARMEAGYSQKDLAQVLGCSSGRIANYEFGRTDIPLFELETLADHLNVPMSYFLDQGVRPHGEQVAGIDELERLAQLPEDVRQFMLQPGNLLYVRVAMRLSTLSADALRDIAEGLLDITY
jgi:transcriptional regulator with XRE-family HTH domain